MYTFSQMVDEMVSEVKRPDLTSEIVRYLNQTIRECHFDPQTNAAQFYTRNGVELALTATAENGHVWQMPNPTNFQKMAAVQYATRFGRDGESVWAVETTPGRHLRDLDAYFYQSGSSVVFSGYGGVNAQINLFYFRFPASLPYFKPGCRPMEYDAYGGKVYAPEWIHEHSRDDADCLTTNWILQTWSDIVAEGVRAKVYKRVSDTERARTCYSLYAQLRRGLMTSESATLYTGG